MLVLNDGVLPIVDAAEQFGGTPCERRRATRSSCAATASAWRSRSAPLDGQRELVTRPLPPEVSEGSALSGAAVLSDGQIALIVDCDAIAENYTRARGVVA